MSFKYETADRRAGKQTVAGKATISALWLAAVFSIFPVANATAQDESQPKDEPRLMPAQSAETFAPIPADMTNLNDFIWQKRPVVVFADSPADPAFADQLAELEDRWLELAARDVVVITDTDPANPSAIRQKLRPTGFALVIIAKDGTVTLRKPLPWSGREVIRSIDKMPLRREEIRRGAASAGDTPRLAGTL